MKQPTARQLAASKKRWQKLVTQMKRFEAPLMKRKLAIEVKAEKQIEKIRARADAEIAKIWKTLERKRAPFRRRIEKEIAFKLS